MHIRNVKNFAKSSQFSHNKEMQFHSAVTMFAVVVVLAAVATTIVPSTYNVTSLTITNVILCRCRCCCCCGGYLFTRACLTTVPFIAIAWPIVRTLLPTTASIHQTFISGSVVQFCCCINTCNY